MKEEKVFKSKLSSHSPLLQIIMSLYPNAKYLSYTVLHFCWHRLLMVKSWQLTCHYYRRSCSDKWDRLRLVHTGNQWCCQVGLHNEKWWWCFPPPAIVAIMVMSCHQMNFLESQMCDVPIWMGWLLAMTQQPSLVLMKNLRQPL